MKVAIIHDDFVQHGGAERLVLGLAEIYPDADYYTSLASKEWVSEFQRRGLRLLTTPMQRLPLKEKLYRYYFFLYPLAFESLDLSSYDLVISSSARFAHAVITKPQTRHVAYINSPARMFWESHNYFYGFGAVKKILLTPPLSFFRLYDFNAARRPDVLVANSKAVAEKIRKYWQREASSVIYPFVENKYFEKPLEGSTDADKDSRASGGYLIISRLSRWKRIDTAIEACNLTARKLVVIGSGPEMGRLQKLAGPTVKLLGYVSEEEKMRRLALCRALIQPQREDFGVTALEAMAFGKPVIAYGAGGALETVVDDKTGIFFDEQTTGSIIKALDRFESLSFDPVVCRTQANKFNKERFMGELKNFIEQSADSNRKPGRFWFDPK